MPAGEKTKLLWQNPEYRAHMTRVHKENSLLPPSRVGCTPWNKGMKFTTRHPNEPKNEWRKRNPWYASFQGARRRCVRPTNTRSDKYYFYKGIKFLMTIEEYKIIWFRDKAYLMKKPSIDRIDSKGNYEVSNCRFIESFENSRRVNHKKGREDE